MDHLLEHDGQPIPDPSAVESTSTGAAGAGAGGEPMDEDDEDAAALRAVYGAAGVPSASAADLEARVRVRLRLAAAGLLKLVCVQSIKCSQCGKIFKNTALANFHAEKSGHDQFEESTEEVACYFVSAISRNPYADYVTVLQIKPLTEEEKKQKLADLRKAMAEKRARKAKEEEKDNKANILLQRKAGKVART